MKLYGKLLKPAWPATPIAPRTAANAASVIFWFSMSEAWSASNVCEIEGKASEKHHEIARFLEAHVLLSEAEIAHAV